jgi:hypothetical protein
MSIKLRSILGAVALFGGLLLMMSGSVWKSSDRIRYQRDLERKVPDPVPPQTTGGNVSLVLGLFVTVAGAGVLGVAVRDMARQIDQAGSNAEAAMRRAVMDKRDPNVKP